VALASKPELLTINLVTILPPYRLYRAVVCALIASTHTPALLAAEGDTRPPIEWNTEVAIGSEYDSNVALDEVDLSTRQSDYALTLDAKISATSTLTTGSTLKLSYDYAQSLYSEFSNVDRQTHILGGSMDSDFDIFDAGLSVFYINSSLDHSKFLELYRVSPSVSSFISKKVFARSAYVYSDKDIENSRQRNAISHTGEADLYYFRRGLRSYFNAGVQFKYENAEASEYDYKSQQFKLRYVQRFELFTKIATLELAYRYEDRNYTSDTPSIGGKRADRRNRWRIDIEIPILAEATLQFYGGYADYESNLPRADYDQEIIGTRFIYRW
jgi:hypothetical protein